jgi:hypothetical protein
MSIALQQEVVTLREQLTETRAQLSKLQAQYVVGESKRSDLATRVAQLEDALAGLINGKQAPKESQHGNARTKARA